jgi:antitoxin (DNA-binding transcriptional repressor) of toxin-antitoxin stability system
MFPQIEGTMKAINIRQLKNNPSEALRAARESPVIVMNRDEPEALIVHLDDETILAEKGVRQALATALYREGSVSLGQAAGIAAMGIAEFMAHASRLSIPVIRGGRRDVEAEARAIEAWRTASS